MRRLPGQRELWPRVSTSNNDRQIELAKLRFVCIAFLQPCPAQLGTRGDETGRPRGMSRPRGWTLWNHSQCQRFTESDFVGRLAEINAARRADALDVASKR